MKINKILKTFVCALLVLTLFTGCSSKNSTDTTTSKSKVKESSISTEERVNNMSKKFDIVLEDYSSYYENDNIKKCLMATSDKIMYSYTEFDTKENAKKKFNEGMDSYKDKVTNENSNKVYHLYEIKQNLKTSKVDNKTTIDKAVNSDDSDAKEVNYTTYNVLEGKVIVSIMVATDNSKELQTALNTMEYSVK